MVTRDSYGKNETEVCLSVLLELFTMKWCQGDGGADNINISPMRSTTTSSRSILAILSRSDGVC